MTTRDIRIDVREGLAANASPYPIMVHLQLAFIGDDSVRQTYIAALDRRILKVHAVPQPPARKVALRQTLLLPSAPNVVHPDMTGADFTALYGACGESLPKPELLADDGPFGKPKSIIADGAPLAVVEDFDPAGASVRGRTTHESHWNHGS